MKNLKGIFLLFLSFYFFFLMFPQPIFSHGGGLDSLGCHHNRKQGGYHCHRGALAGQYFETKEDALIALNSNSAQSKQFSEEKEEPIIILKKVVRVIDGDTIVVDGGEKIRLIGVDTPETVHPKKQVEFFGKEASEFTRSMVEGKKVRLEYDQQKTDKYGRTLAYVFLEDGFFLNAEIIKQGFGFAYTKFPFKYLDEFRKYEREARENNRGLWKEE